MIPLARFPKHVQIRMFRIMSVRSWLIFRASSTMAHKYFVRSVIGSCDFIIHAGLHEPGCLELDLKLTAKLTENQQLPLHVDTAEEDLVSTIAFGYRGVGLQSHTATIGRYLCCCEAETVVHILARSRGGQGSLYLCSARVSNISARSQEIFTSFLRVELQKYEGNPFAEFGSGIARQN